MISSTDIHVLVQTLLLEYGQNLVICFLQYNAANVMDIPSIIRLQEIVTFLLLADSFVGFDDANCYVGEAHVTRN